MPYQPDICIDHDEDDFKLGREKCEEALREKIAEHIEKTEAALAPLRAAIAA